MGKVNGNLERVERLVIARRSKGKWLGERGDVVRGSRYYVTNVRGKGVAPKIRLETGWGGVHGSNIKTVSLIIKYFNKFSEFCERWPTITIIFLV